jgi:small subunit ribosomal protein S6
MPDYELVTVLAPTLDDEAVQTQVEAVTRRIEQLGGQVVKTEGWGRRTLAYPIKKYHEGHYVLFNVQMPAKSVAELERDLKIAEPVIRHLVVRANE